MKMTFNQRMKVTRKSLEDYPLYMGTAGKIIIPLACIALAFILNISLINEMEGGFSINNSAEMHLDALIGQFLLIGGLMILGTIVYLLGFSLHRLIILIKKAEYTHRMRALRKKVFIDLVEIVVVPYSLLILVIAFLVAGQTEEEMRNNCYLSEEWTSTTCSDEIDIFLINN